MLAVFLFLILFFVYFFYTPFGRRKTNYISFLRELDETKDKKSYQKKERL